MAASDIASDEGCSSELRESLTKQLPPTWAPTTLGDVFKWGSGGTPQSGNSDYYGGSIPWLVIGDLADGVVSKSATTITEAGLANSSAKLVGTGAVLLAMYGSIGKLGIAGKPLSTNQAIAFAETGEIYNLYLFYFLRYVRDKLASLGKGATQLNISQAVIKAFPFALAPGNEQRRIVAKIEELFSELDKGIESLKTAQAQLKVYRQALLKHAFEGKLTAQWRADNPDKLETADALLERIHRERAQSYQQQVAEWEAGGKQGCKPKAPKSLSPLTAEELAELPELPDSWVGGRLGWMTCGVEYGTATKSSESGTCPVLRMGNIQNGKFDWTDLVYTDDESEIAKYVVRDGDVLFNRTNSPELVGKAAVFKGIRQALFAGYLIRVNQIPTIADSEYLNFFLNSHIAKQHGNTVKTDGVNQSNINGEKLVNYPFPYCSLDEQRAMVKLLDERLSEADQLDQTLTTSLQQAEALRQSILKKAFSGRLVAQDANDEPASMLLARIKAEKAAHLERGRPRKPQDAPVPPVPDKSKVLAFPARIAGISATDMHAGILAMAYRLHEQDPKRVINFGHVKAEKISHLIESHLGIDLERMPFKDAAGPNDYPHLKKVEFRARKANWFDVRQQNAGGAYVFSRKPGFDALLNKTADALGGRLAEVDALLQTLLPLNTRQAEIVATLYAAWNNLLLAGKAAADEDIVHEARENWHKAKLDIEREKFFRGLEWMRKHGLVPVGRGRYVAEKGKPSQAGRVNA